MRRRDQAAGAPPDAGAGAAFAPAVAVSPVEPFADSFAPDVPALLVSALSPLEDDDFLARLSVA